MSGGFPILGEFCAGIDYGTDSVNRRGTAIAAGGASSWGSYTQIVAATTQDAILGSVSIQTNGGANAKNINLVRLAIGAAGSELPIADGLPIVMLQAGWQNMFYNFPVAIPAGTRLSAANCGGDVVYVQASLFDGSICSFFEAAGIEAVTSNLTNGVCGTAVSGTTPAFGSYSQIVAATTRDYCGLIAILSPSSYGSSGPPGANDQQLWDIALGPSGSEVSIISNDIYVWAAGVSPQPSTYIVDIPSGSRLSVKFGSSFSAETLGITLLGIYK